MGEKQRLAAATSEHSDSEDDSDYCGSSGESETGESSYGDEVHDNNDVPDEEDQSGGSESDQAAEESDSSEDEVAHRNTVGNVPLKWYEDEKHIGYDIKGKKVAKKVMEDKIASFLESADDSGNWRKFRDEYNQEMVELTKEEIKVIRNLVKGTAPHLDFDPYPTYSDWFEWDGKHPLSNAPEPKRRFTPSKWEAKKVVELVRGIRNGSIKFDKPKEAPRFSLLWGDDSISAEKTRHLSYIQAPKPKLPGHEESYNPSIEYIPTQEEINSYQLMDEEDRPQFVPKRFASVRSLPAYENAVKESFERCLDLYLCPRVRKNRLNIDPESLKPKLPSKKDLKPYPTTCYLEYKGHKGAVMSISIDASGQWIASGSTDGTVRIWEVDTGRCLKIWEFDEAANSVAWNPLPELPLLAIAVGLDLFLLNTGLGSQEVQKKVKELLHVETPIASDVSGNAELGLSWIQDDKHGGIRLRHFKTISSVEWHRKGDYCCTLMPAGESKAILIHMLSKKLTQRLPFKLHGLPVSCVFHPTRSIFFAATKKNVRVYDLLKHKLMKKLESGLREISSIAIHPGGDNLIVGSRDGKLCWFDMDLSSKPYRVLKCHPKDVSNVAFHRSYPLFASCSDDCTAYVFHGMVYSDLNQNPLIVPLEILRGHSSSNGRGVMDCKFHPRQPWLFTAGADSLIRLYCH
ncbi:ribosome biogenesis protein BOP1 homolog isoform X2 [Euphorbia lathyris]|uniref:ribosome biogenesis protein BOP1 homolog isoform X2 n=1 Tax=Euphorbia lathyris TaxID=212925 RepID=UPI003313493E